MKISVVIPTRNRPQQIRDVLNTLQQQTLPPAEIVVVDASDEEYNIASAIRRDFADLPLQWLTSNPSVCVQRNKGIARAKHQWIFLCDDDIELPEDHFEKLADYLERHPECGAVAGRLRQCDDGVWSDHYALTKFSSVLYHFVFQISVWGALDKVRTNFLFKPLLDAMRGWYRRRGNSVSLSGWPVITNWKADVFQTKFYSLGANLIRKAWLQQSPYDSVLDASGIGDNYGVALGFPGNIHVIATTHALHHRAKANRLNQVKAYYRRILALHYFVRTKYTNPRTTTCWLCWSIFGLAISQASRLDVRTLGASLKLMTIITFGQNPYVKAKNRGLEIVTPD